VRIVEATEEQKRERDALTFEAWGALLDPAGYETREARLRAHRWPRVVMKTWLLCDGDAVLASCESYRMRSFRRGAPSSTWSIASVFTERALRGRGYATQLMRLLEDRVRELDPTAHALALYSDVGGPIYERAGYVARPAQDRVWPAQAGTAGAELLTEMFELPPPGDPFVVWPDAAQLDWHLERKRIYAELLAQRTIGNCGARAEGGVMFWTAGYRHDRLQVLAWNCIAFEPLIATAQRVAAQAGFAHVVMWDQPGAQGGTLAPREGSLPMLRALDPNVRAEDWLTIPRAVWV
jgi:GNAT superfamily N-acetyltransferase